MLNTEILDIAIGLIFVYLLLSLICSAVNEIIETRHARIVCIFN
jgi:F0F1-type ATP synthase membrane subunit b/b'